MSMFSVIFLQVLQLYQITQLHHGLMMVGPSGSGKSTAWRVLLKALERIEGVEGVAHIIDPKVGGDSPHCADSRRGFCSSVLCVVICKM